MSLLQIFVPLFLYSPIVSECFSFSFSFLSVSLSVVVTRYTLDAYEGGGVSL